MSHHHLRAHTPITNSPTAAPTLVSCFVFSTYFAVDCKYSHNGGYVSQLPNGLYQVLVVAVVVGRSAQGSRGMKRLPPVPGGGPHMRVNSLVDDVFHPKIYVVQHSNQAYPAFVITYSFHDVIDLCAE